MYIHNAQVMWTSCHAWAMHDVEHIQASDDTCSFWVENNGNGLCIDPQHTCHLRQPMHLPLKVSFAPPSPMRAY
jgi:hypothetical protein